VRRLLADRSGWSALPEQVADWLELQRLRSALPTQDDLLVETFPRGERFYMALYPFEGRLAHTTLGMLLTRRMERAGLRPLGFVANDYALCVWALNDIGAAVSRGGAFLADLLAEDMLGDDLEEWLQEAALMKRTFRNCAIVAGMIERNFIGRQKTSRQVRISTDLIYNVLRRHEPDHILLQAARADAAGGLLDLDRLAAMLARAKGRIVHKALNRVSPLAVTIMLEIGRESVYGEAQDAILAEAADELIEEAQAAG
jgi:ATP-dependent Lhr-like helicase